MPIPPPTPRVFKTYEMIRLISAMFLLGIIGMMFIQMRKTWWEGRSTALEQPLVIPPNWEETIVDHDGSQDPEQIAEARFEFEAISDRQDIHAEEMPLYWRFLRWGLCETYRDLQARAAKDVFYTHLAKNPDKHRGELVYLRLHVVLVRPHKPERNAIDLKEVYEVWGSTDESGTNPFVVVVADKPPGLPIGGKLQEEVRFAGFFYKNFGYKAIDEKQRIAPMLIGRLEYIPNAVPAAIRYEKQAGFWFILAIGCVCALVFGLQFKGTGRVRSPLTPEELEAQELGSVERFIEQVATVEKQPVTAAPVTSRSPMDFPDVLQLDEPRVP